MRILLANFTKMVQDSGGLAKVNCAFSNAMVERGHEVATVYSDDREGEFFFPVDARVQRYNLRHFRGQSILFPTTLKVKREILRAIDQRRGRAVNNAFTVKYLKDNVQAILEEFRPDVIVAFQTAATMVSVCELHTERPGISMSHGDPEDYFHTYDPAELPALEQCAACQVLLPSFKEHLRQHCPRACVEVIGNVVPHYAQQAELAAAKNVYKIIFVGRLVKNHKRPHLLIEAFGRIAHEFPDWQVERWGAEDKKRYTQELQQLIRKYHLEQRVFLKGSTTDVPSVLQQGDICACPSAYEGFPLAMTEAMSMGLPVVGFRSAPAVNELVKDGENGILCDDGAESYSQGLARLMSDQTLRAQMGQQARDSVQAYSASSIWQQWLDLMEQVRH